MDKEVSKAFGMLLAVPLDEENEQEYMNMKSAVYHYLEVIAKAGKLEDELKEATEELVRKINSPEFLEFAKKVMGTKPTDA